MKQFDDQQPAALQSFRKIFSALLFFCCMAFADRAIAANYTPTTFTDPDYTSINNATGVITGGAGVGLISLRSAIQAADNNGAGPHTITLLAGTYNITGGANIGSYIIFGSFAQNITITGAAGPTVTSIINMAATTAASLGGFRDRIFFINYPFATTAGVVTTLNNLKFTNGNHSSDPYGGGAIRAGGPGNILNINNCVFENNTMDLANGGGTTGGAINVSGGGALNIDNSQFTSNINQESDGGAVYYFFANNAGLTGSVSITNSTFTSNQGTGPNPGGSRGGAIGIATQGSLGGRTFTANITENNFINNTAAADGGAIFINNGDPTYTININFNRFVGNSAANVTNGALAKAAGSSGAVNAINNWWGCNTDPATAGNCNRAGTVPPGGGGALTTTPWLQLKTTPSPAQICTSQVTTFTSSFLTNSANVAVPLASLDRLIGLPISFVNPTLGTLSAAQPNITAAGTATVTFTAGTTGGNGTVNAVVDNLLPTATGPAQGTVFISRPVVNNPGVTTGTVNIPFSQNFTMTGGFGAGTFSTSSTLPANLTLSAAGVLSGTPVVVGTFPIVVNVVDAIGCTGTGVTYNLVLVCQVIPVVNPAVTTGTVGTAFSQTFTSSNTIGAVSYTLNTGTLPTGLSLSSAGVLSGTPTQFGTFPLTVMVTDGNGCTGISPTYNLVISCQTITVTNPGVTTGTNGTPFSQTFTQVGALGGATFTTASTLPNGLTLSTAGVLSGTPSAPAGAYPIVVTVTDGNGCSANGPTYNLVISCQAMSVTNPGITTGQINVPFSQTFTQTGGIGATTFSTVSALPTGITLSPAGVLSGTPTVTGTFPIVVTATDANGCTASGATYTLVISACSVVDQTVSALPTSVCVGGSSTITVGASQPGVNYYLRTSPTNTVIAGPTASNGPAINFPTGAIAATTTYNVLAELDKYSINLNGGQAGFTIPHSASLNIINNFTVEGWIKPAGNPNFARLYNKDGSFALGLSNNQTRIDFVRHGMGDFTVPFTFVNGQWYHIACTYATGTVQFFVNGVSVGTVVAPAVVSSVQPAHIGSDAGGNFNQFNGNIDNVRLWSSVRTPAEIAANQTAYLTSTGNPTLAASWWIIEGAGNARDFSANANNASAFVGLWQIDSPVPSCNIVLSTTPTVTVPGINTINLTSGAGTNAQTVCNNTPITNITYATTGATGATFAGLPAGVTGNWAANVVTISGTPTVASGVFNYTVTLTGGCGIVTANGSITVTANNTINLTSAAGTNAQTVCINTAITNITYGTTGATGATFAGLPAGVTGNWATNVVTISGTPTAAGVFNYTVTLTGGCGIVTANGSITVTAANTITLTSAAGTNAQTVCNNTAITSITYATTGATGANFSGLPTGVTGNWAANVVTISGTPSVAGTFNYTVTLTGGCGVITANGSITVNPIPDVNQPASQVVCNGAPTAPVNFSGAVPGTTFSWTNTTTSIGLAASGTGNIASFTATNATNAPVTATVTVTPSTSGLQTFANTGAITIPATGTSGPATPYPSNIVVSGVTGSVTAVTIKINNYSHTFGDDVDVLLVGPGGQNAIIMSDVGGSFAVPGVTLTLNDAAATNLPDAAQLTTGTFRPTNIGGGDIFNAPAPAPAGGSVLSVFNGIPANGTWSLYVMDDVGGDIGTFGGGWEITLATSGITCTGSSKNFTITVNPTATVNTVPNQTVCHGMTTTAVAFSSPATGGTIVYNWTNNTPSIGLAASGSGNIAAFTASNLTALPVTATITVTPSYTNGGTTCIGTPTSFTITVNPTADVAQPANQAVCNGAATAAVNFTGTTAGTTYNWTNNTTSIGLAASGTGNIASFTATNATNAPVTATITVTPTLTGSDIAYIPSYISNNVTVFDINANAIITTIGVGNGPHAVALNPAGTRLYIPNFNSNDVSVINTATNTVITTIPVGTNPRGAAVSPDGSRVYISNRGTNSVAVIDAATNTVITTISVGDQPTGITVSPDGLRVYTANNISNNVSVINTVTNTVIATVPTSSGPFGIAITPDGSKVYTSNLPSNNSTVINTATNTVITTINGVGSGPAGISASPDGSKIFIAAVNGAIVTTISTATNSILYTVPTATSPSGTSVNATGTRAYAVNQTSQNISVINTITNTAVTSASIGVIAISLGNYIRTVIPSCPGPSKTFTITVNPTPTVNAVANQDVCNGQMTTAVNFTGAVAGTVYNWTNNAPSIGLAASGAGDIAAFTATNLTNNPVVATITVTPSYTNAGTTCTGTPISFTITVNPKAHVNPVASQVRCNGTATAAVTFSGNTANTIYNWTNNAPSIGLAASGTGNIASFTATNTTGAPVVATITVTPEFTGGSGSCPGDPITFTITVNPTPTVNAVANQVVCNGAATTPVIFSGNTSGTLCATANEGGSITLTAPPGTVITGIVFASYGTPNGVCGNFTTSGCHAANSMAIVSGMAIGQNSVTIPATNGVFGDPCSGTPKRLYVQAVYSATGTTVYNWTNNTTSIGLAASGTGNIPSFTAINTGITPVTATITVTPSYTNAATTCVGSPITFTITVNPTPNAVATPASQTICSGATITTIILSSNVSGTTFAWSRDNTGSVTGIAASGSGNISGSLTNTTNAPITVTFTITPTANSCPGTPITATVLVNPTPNAVATPASQTVCSGVPITTIVLSGNVSGTTYSWVRDNLLTVTGIASNGTGNISGTMTNTTNAPITVTFTITPTANGCPGPSITATVLLNPTPNAVATPASQTVCSGLPITTIVLSGNVSGTTYNWTRDNTGSVTGIAAAGSGNISGTLTNTTFAPITVTFTITPTANGCPGPSITATVLVNPTPDATATPAAQTICSGATITTIVLSGNVAGTTYTWFRDNTGTVTGIAGAGSGNISGSLTNTTFAPITVTFTITPSANGCLGTPITATVIVNPIPTVNPVANQVVCNNSPTAAVNFTGAVTGTVYNWTNNNTTIGLAASGTGNIPSFTAINTGTVPVTATITVTPTYTNGGTTCTGSPTTFTITVNPTPTVNAVANQTLCNGASTAAVNFSGTVPGTVFNWTNNTPSIGLAASGTGNIPSFVAVNTTVFPVTATITVTPTYTNGGTTCSGTPITFTITVNPTPTLDPPFPANQVLCNGAPSAAVVLTGPVPGTFFTWTNNQPSIGLAASGAGNIPSFTAINTGTAPVVATITITPQTTSCTGVTTTFTITVNPTPTVNVIANQTLCNGATTAAVTISGPVPGTVFNWTNNTTSIGLGAAGTGNIPAFVAINNTSAPVTATITVTPTYTNAGVTCTGPVRTFTITVNPIPVVNGVAGQVVCNGAATNAVNFSGPVAGTVFSWTNNTTSIGLAASGTGNIASFTAVNTGTTPVTATILVTPSANGCTGTATAFTITVNPTANVNAIANQTLCAGLLTTAVNFTGTVSGTIFNWTNNTPSIGLAASGTGNILPFIAINTTIFPVTATITVTPTTSNGCAGVPRTFTITVNPLVNISLSLNPPRVCLTDTLVTLKASPAGGIWTGLGVIPGTNIFSPVLAGVGVSTLVYTVTTGCGGIGLFSITVNDCKERHNVLQTALRIYPNPSNGQFKIAFLTDLYKELSIKVIKPNGQIVGDYYFSNLIYGSIIPMDLRKLPSGMYILQAYNSQERASYKIVIAH